ncbi:MAG: aspartate--ammonia ligase [Lentisphaeria bacterium]|nr:aspartate--ammonia ligase [Lentisphaeria bacterium]
MSTRQLLPGGYEPLLDELTTEVAIRKIKESFQNNLAFELKLQRVTAPLFVRSGTGINDDLNGVERPVSFPIKGDGERRAEIVHSLAKWKRLKLASLRTRPGRGIYTDMNAIRPDEDLDNIHSLYVDQWDWEKVITDENRSVEYLKDAVRRIYYAILRTEDFICRDYPVLKPFLPEEIKFHYTEDLEAEYPNLTPKEREDKVCQEEGAVFLIGIGGALPKSGEPHDGRAPDYDDWTSESIPGHHGLNGDILVWNPVLKRSFELSSMGIRVNQEALLKQLSIRHQESRLELSFHKELLAGHLPLSMGGGIGQSRLCMLLLQKAHIGEIQSSIWPDEMIARCREHNIPLL